jgi:hypothetical protein
MRPHREKLSTLVLRLKQEPCTPPCPWCRPHTISPVLLIVWPPSIRLVLDHSRSSTPNQLLLHRSLLLPTMPHLSPTHHETSKHISPHETDSMIEPPKFPGFKFKPRQVNYSSQIKPRTTWFLRFSILNLAIYLLILQCKYYPLVMMFLGS